MSLEWLLAGAAAWFGIVAIVNALTFPRMRGSKKPLPTNSVSVLIPARDEEETLPGCIESVLAQGNTVAEVLIYDDESSDRTREIAIEWSVKDSRVRLVPTNTLPAGWYGKPHACMQLAQHATGEWLLFLDADTRLAPGAVEQLLATAQRYCVPFLSAWPRLEMISLSEKLLMPMLNFYVFTLLPTPLQQWSLAPRYALAHGACILCERSVYTMLYGHGSVRSELFEDTALARYWRSRGIRTLCCDGSGVRVRMYRTFGQIWQGFTKNFYPGFRHASLFVLVLAIHALVFTLPFGLLLGAFSLPAIIAAGSVVVARLALAFRFGQPVWPILFHPFAELVLLALGVYSWWRWNFTSGVEWKGRSYRHVQPASTAQ
ncbi:MAG: glycosyltransferase family 2 protein [Bacteroidota bacterium]|nr:glycosyltransferase family 2 protein [Bacteroidota bacterium]